MQRNGVSVCAFPRNYSFKVLLAPDDREAKVSREYSSMDAVVNALFEYLLESQLLGVISVRDEEPANAGK